MALSVGRLLGLVKSFTNPINLEPLGENQPTVWMP